MNSTASPQIDEHARPLVMHSCDVDWRARNDNFVANSKEINHLSHSTITTQFYLSTKVDSTRNVLLMESEKTHTS